MGSAASDGGGDEDELVVVLPLVIAARARAANLSSSVLWSLMGAMLTAAAVSMPRKGSCWKLAGSSVVVEAVGVAVPRLGFLRGMTASRLLILLFVLLSVLLTLLLLLRTTTILFSTTKLKGRFLKGREPRRHFFCSDRALMMVVYHVWCKLMLLLKRESGCDGALGSTAVALAGMRTFFESAKRAVVEDEKGNEIV